MMHRAGRQTGIRVTILVAAFVLALPVSAQETDTTAAAQDTLEQRELSDLDWARASLQELSKLESDMRELLQSARMLKGEEYELKRVEALEIVERFDDLTQGLVKIISDVDTTSARVDSIRQETTDHLLYHGDLYLEAVKSLDRTQARLRRRRVDAARPRIWGNSSCFSTRRERGWSLSLPR